MDVIAGLIYDDPGREVEDRTVAGLIPSSRLRETSRRGGRGWTVVGPAVAGADVADATVVADLDIANLDGLPESWRDGSTAELAYRLYQREGLEFLQRLEGGFVFVVWLPGPRKLVVATDRLGFRRLYYAISPAGIAFSSHVRGPLTLDGTVSDVDPSAIYAYLNFQVVPAPQTPYRSVRRLPPGHTLTWERGRTTLTPYWNLDYADPRRISPTAAEDMARHTEEAVRRHLVGVDVSRTGAFLSGGTDSSTVVGLMSRLIPEKVSAFSIGFSESRYNELDYAELAARHFGAAHYTRLVTADDAFAAVPALVRAYDEPFGNSSVIPTYLCASHARASGMSLLLAGDGGDEIFGGNERYRREQILSRYALIPSVLRHALIEPILRALPAGGLNVLGKMQRYVQRASSPNPERFYSSEFFFAQERGEFLQRDFLASVEPDWPLVVARNHYNTPRTKSELHRLMYLDLKVTLGDNDLYKVTRAAETAGMAVRFPLLDRRLVEFCGGLPAKAKVAGDEKRVLFKRAFAPLLPAAILAKVKHGFGLPMSDWLKEHRGFRELARDTLSADASRGRGYFAPGAIERLFKLHEADHTPFYGELLWMILMLELWHLEHGVER